VNMHELLIGLAIFLLFILALSATLPCAYLLLLTLFSAALPTPPRSSRRYTFDVIVPAHNESAGIARTVGNLLRLDWPRNQFRVLVIADNCTDSTAEVARAAGAEVFIRNDTERRGKGYALAYAFDQSGTHGCADAVVVVDADSEASTNLLEAFAARLEGGATVVQAHYGVLNAQASWRTRLMAIALGSFHMLRSRGRERLKVSCGIRGNGWCVTHALLREIPYSAFSLTEDIEFGIDLGLKGRRAFYCEEAKVEGEMVTGREAARSQRQRWEGGRLNLIRSKILPLLAAIVVQRSLICLDLALDLLVPPLSYLALNVIAFLVVSAATWQLLSRHGYLWISLADVTVLCVYVLRGWKFSNVGRRGLIDLARAPGFILWKVLLMVGGRKSQQWVRTDRERP
jgi:cellulose synthase/poly-beta-1,6-N-acetylglucosamine synthase-like glycosyltransferase